MAYRGLRRSLVLGCVSMAGLLASAGLALGQSAGGSEKQAAAPEASTAKLKVGDAAPALAISNWVQGQPLTGFERGKVYVVEFWATWCGPCRRSIPHLTKLQKQHGDAVTIIGISGKDRTGESVEKVKAFVDDFGEKMKYTVAFDDERKTRAAYMEAAGQNGIPTAFVVDREGKIAWIGNPLYPQGEIDLVIEAAKAGKASEAELKTIHEHVMERQGKITDLQRKAMNASAGGKHDEALAAFDELASNDPESAVMYRLEKFNILLLGKKDYNAAYALAREITEGPAKDDAQVLNEIAWKIVDEQGIEKRDLDLAMKVAERAVEVSKQKDPAIIDTLARVYFDKGDAAKAAEWQAKAVGMATGRMKTDLEASLEKYQKAIKK